LGEGEKVNPSPWPKRVSALRAALELTQVQFADLIGVTPTYVSMLERGKHPVGGPLAKLLELMEKQHAISPLQN